MEPWASPRTVLLFAVVIEGDAVAALSFARADCVSNDMSVCVMLGDAGAYPLVYAMLGDAVGSVMRAVGVT